MKPVYLVTGASGKLGRAFIDHLQKTGEEVVGLSRSGAEGAYTVDLTDTAATNRTIANLSIEPDRQVILVHTVGKFKFEKIGAQIHDADGDGIDDEVYATNVVTLKNLVEALQGQTKHIRACVFASVSDKHDVPFWRSYTQAKNILRKYLRHLCEVGAIRALVVNVSTVDTGNENALRPNADKTYWLKPEEVVAATLPALLQVESYAEIDVIKEKPDFDISYYSDPSAVLTKWDREMGA